MGDKLFATFWGISSHSISLFHLLPLLEQTIRGEVYFYILCLCCGANGPEHVWDGSAASPEALWFAASWKYNTNIAVLWASHRLPVFGLAPCLEVLLISKWGAKDIYFNHAATRMNSNTCSPSVRKFYLDWLIYYLFISQANETL